MVPSADELNMLRARLSVESAEDEDQVMRALSGVMVFSGLYAGDYSRHRADPSAVPMDELRKTEKRVRENMDQLEQTVRRRVAAAERPLPAFSLPSFRKTKPK
jgi:hypothetical protein